MKTIDLHGMIENEAISAIHCALLDFETNKDDKLEIIVGNGMVLKDVAIEILKEENWKWTFNGSNHGSIIVKK